MKFLKPLPETINGIKVIADLGMNNQIPKKRIAKFQCECNNFFIAKVNSVKSFQRVSCGCKVNGNPTHGLSKHPLYRKWSGMITRTTNKKENCYKRYGGRGISVCEEWKNNFMSFYNWSINNGWEKGLTIDRIDVNGNYEPNNCQWITMRENTIKDMNLFRPTENQIKEICKLYVDNKLTITYISKIFKTHKENISNILKKNNIQINKNRRMKKCY